MTLLYFALCILASLLVIAGLFWLRREDKRENKQPETTKSSFSTDDSPFHYEFKKTVYMVADKPHKPLGWKTARQILEDNEDTRPLPAHEDSFSHDELWEAAANIPRENTAQKKQIDKWVKQAFEDAGEDWL